MNNKYINIYNNLVDLTRNKNLYVGFKEQDTFSDRLVFFLLHFAFFLKVFKNNDKKILQDLYDYIFKQLELSIREIGYGDASINKKMKDYVNLFHDILNKIENWNSQDKLEKSKIITFLLNTNNSDNLTVYFDNYSRELQNNTLNYYLNSVIKSKI